MKVLMTHQEAARDFFDGDEDALRQAILFRGLRPLVEYHGTAVCDEIESLANKSGETPYARWRSRTDGRSQLDGWFYVDKDSASAWLADRRSSEGFAHLWCRPDSGIPWWGDFVLDMAILGPLWFLASELRELTEPSDLLPVEVPGQKAEAMDRAPPDLRADAIQTYERVIAALWAKAHGDGLPGSLSNRPSTAAKSLANALASAGISSPSDDKISRILSSARGHGIKIGSS